MNVPNAPAADNLLLDSKTGLPIKLGLPSFTEWLISYAKRYGNKFAVLYIGIDQEQPTILNPTANDSLLQGVSKRLCNAVRKSDVVSRISTGAFAIVLTNISELEDAARVSKKILDGFRKPFRVDGSLVPVPLKASVGISVFPVENANANLMLRTAEATMHEVKRQGKSGYQFYQPELTTQASDRLQLEADLHSALEDGHIVAYYQSRVDLVTGNVVAVDTRAKWNHPTQGLLPAESFIPLAEKSGLVIEVRERITQRACRDVKRWQELGVPLTLAVPLSVRQLERPNLVERMMEILVASNFDSTLFQLELAGSLLLQDAKYLRGVLERFRELGIRVAINEFGAGYTSLRQLAQLPIDTLKVDRSFIAGVPSDPELMSIVESMVQMGDSLGLTIVAEGVESREQFDFLREIGCHQCQGDLIGEAISAADFGRCLKEDPCSVHFLHDKRTGVPIILCEPDTKWI